MAGPARGLRPGDRRRRREQLQEVAVEVILQAASARALSNILAATGGEIRELGANEVAEGLLRKIAAEAMAEESEELAIAGIELAAQGLKSLAQHRNRRPYCFAAC